MRLRILTLRTVAATAISLWMAFLACFMGCALPALANGGSRGSSIPSSIPSSITQGAAEQNAVERDQADPLADPMAGMENCPHHSAGKIPGKPADGKSAPSRMSCCPLEITVAPRPDTAVAAIAPAQGFVLASGLPLTASFSSSLEVVPSVYHSGRDTLRKIGLLRI